MQVYPKQVFLEGIVQEAREVDVQETGGQDAALRDPAVEREVLRNMPPKMKRACFSSWKDFTILRRVGGWTVNALQDTGYQGKI